MRVRKRENPQEHGRDHRMSAGKGTWLTNHIRISSSDGAEAHDELLVVGHSCIKRFTGYEGERARKGGRLGEKGWMVRRRVDGSWLLRLRLWLCLVFAFQFHSDVIESYQGNNQPAKPQY